jgi:hypothetical protein
VRSSLRSRRPTTSWGWQGSVSYYSAVKSEETLTSHCAVQDFRACLIFEVDWNYVAYFDPTAYRTSNR